MRKVILLMHTSLDGFVAGPNGEIDWVKVDDELFDYVGNIVDEADTALYGRVTYGMMQSYWPTAAEKPNASKHDIEHSRWYNKVRKIVISRTLQNVAKNTKVISENIPAEVLHLKDELGNKNILMLGSPTAAHILMQHKLIDEFYINVNPVAIGTGVPLFKTKEKINLNLVAAKVFRSGVVGMHYKK